MEEENVVTNSESVEQNIVTEQPPVETQNVTPSTPQPKKSNTAIIVIAIIGGFIILGIIIAVVLLLLFSSEKKLVCTSKEGNITLNYDDKTIKSYVTTGRITYDFDKAREYADQVGIDAYMREFNTWFETNTSGTCVYK